MRAASLVFRLGVSLALLGLVVAAGLLAYGRVLFEAEGPRPADGAAETVLLVERGQGVSAIAARLQSEGLIEDARVFAIGTRVLGADDELKAGEYAIRAGASMHQIVELLRSGRSFQYAFTVAEGLSVLQVMELLDADPVLTGPLPPAPPEGWILPEPYHFTRGTTRAEMLERMRAAQESVLAELWPGRQDNLPLATPEEALILASIVEKETGIAEERPLVASVFINRLRKGIALQSDPTVIYPVTAGKPLGRRIRQSDLDRDSPYNTYRVSGLPPTPIANPGRQAIAAVLDPPETDYLFFVADGTGGHVFAKTLAEHNRNVAAWRQFRREQ
ncbi:MAG: endolytic transglycosylase MltG [Alphaproteobacteria bacterium]|nr:endolytic transglycosylase MltG [Alphaproteobacteria bacterium]